MISIDQCKVVGDLKHIVKWCKAESHVDHMKRVLTILVFLFNCDITAISLLQISWGLEAMGCFPMSVLSRPRVPCAVHFEE